MQVEAPEIPIYVVTGSNWTCEIKMDEDDAEMPVEDQIVEAATKAIEVFNGITENDTYKLTSDDNSAYLGQCVEVCLKGENPDKCKYVISALALGNAGFYKQSFSAQQQMEKEAKRHKKDNDQVEAIFDGEVLKKEKKKRKKKA